MPYKRDSCWPCPFLALSQSKNYFVAIIYYTVLNSVSLGLASGEPAEYSVAILLTWSDFFVLFDFDLKNPKLVSKISDFFTHRNDEVLSRNRVVLLDDAVDDISVQKIDFNCFRNRFDISE